ncbi:MAG TPA: carbohydrate ABC transporter permease [Chloroflexota bacterium]|nr:carbohydrate ABC transporter permease [Chloroflexota bacterium]
MNVATTSTAARRTTLSIPKTVSLGARHVVLIAGSAVMLFPFLWMVGISLGTQSQLYQNPPQWIPNPVLPENYPTALHLLNFTAYLGNTVFITVLSLLGQLLSVTMVAYAFARLRWPGRNALFVVLLATMMIPPQVTQIPLYIIWRGLGAIDTYWPLIIPSYFGDAYLIFFARQFFMTIPVDMEDAARVDGCGFRDIYFKIMLPMSIPLILTVSLFAILWNWNDFYGPLIYLTSPDKFTLQLGLQTFSTSQYRLNYPYFMAAATVIVLPIIVIFLFGQRYFIRSIVLTGLK